MYKEVSLKKLLYLILDNKYNFVNYIIHETSYNSNDNKIIITVSNKILNNNRLNIENNISYYNEFNYNDDDNINLFFNAFKCSSSIKYFNFIVNNRRKSLIKSIINFVPEIDENLLNLKALSFKKNYETLLRLINNVLINKQIIKLKVKTDDLIFDNITFKPILDILKKTNNIENLYLSDYQIHNIDLIYDFIKENSSYKKISLIPYLYEDYDFSIIDKINIYFKENSIKKEVKKYLNKDREIKIKISDI